MVCISALNRTRKRPRLSHNLAKTRSRARFKPRSIDSGIPSKNTIKPVAGWGPFLAGGPMTELHIESILHLSALSLVVSIAYLGLDKVHQEKDAFKESLAKAREKALELVSRCDVTIGADPGPEAIFYRFPFGVRLKFYLLAYIAAAQIKMGVIYRSCHWFHRQVKVPCLRYFDSGFDRIFVSIFALVSLGIFLYLTAAALWDFHWFFLDQALADKPAWINLAWFPMQSVMPVFYWACSFILLWIFFTVGVTHILKNLEKICDSMQTAVDLQMETAAQDVVRWSLRNQPKQSVAPPPSDGNGAA